MKQNLVDRAQFVVRAGNGGEGAVSFRREKYVPKGGPDGGDGGKGGSIWLEVDEHLSTLRYFAGKDRFEAKPGERGSKRDRIGHDAEDLVLKVPVGTVVLVHGRDFHLLEGKTLYGERNWQDIEESGEVGRYESMGSREVGKYGSMGSTGSTGSAGIMGSTGGTGGTGSTGSVGGEDAGGVENLVERFELGTEGELELDGNWLTVVDLDQPGERFLLAKGGKGGRGNARFKSSRLTTPKFAERGEKAERFVVRLELKVLADVGLVGLPNAGKSTLLSVLTRAKPEIASYPFTTVSPNLGVMAIQTNQETKKDIVIADIPGLIEGAAEGKGLGHEFLQHVERCSQLWYVLGADLNEEWAEDGSNLAESLWEQFMVVKKEVESYGHGLVEKPFKVVVNKIDILNQQQREQVKTFFAKKEIEVVLISAATREGLEELE